MTILYYDCFSGISGDMNLAALIDLGVPVDYLRQELKKLPVGGWEIEALPAQKKGIYGTQVNVREVQSTTFSISSISPSLSVKSEGQHAVVQTSHEHRGLREIREIIERSTLSDSVKQLAMNMFERVAVAEAKIHGTTPDKVHFHEVGAIDSIVDTVGAAICIDFLKPDRIQSSTVELGSGFVKCAHGVFPVPAPATAEILKDIPVNIGGALFETTTPTGAAILAANVHSFGPLKNARILKTAYGIGHKDAEKPNVLRVIWAETAIDTSSEFESDSLIELSCNIDDMNPEWFDWIMEKLQSLAVNDVWITPVLMKKSRPAHQLNVLCSSGQFDQVTALILRETPAIGLRYHTVERKKLIRRIEVIDTLWGPVRIKITGSRSGDFKYKPEYEDCKRIALENNLLITDIYQAVAVEFAKRNS